MANEELMNDLQVGHKRYIVLYIFVKFSEGQMLPECFVDKLAFSILQNKAYMTNQTDKKP